ncbi:DUF3526 domain-containing protein [Kordiimonas aquimaris]|uniref:DUF3526 domain-containing protein n=1 Tax=Kordiimonas aquimaris TaxID=707591 RepID=UPI0021D3DDB8|nr:DUF3526 domain-containing protein [Kordiimonas aquimaris]
MTATAVFSRELRFFLKQPFAIWLIIVATGLSTFSVWSGLTEVDRQSATIERLLVADAKDRAAAIEKESDFGGAAYYSFHLTFDPPSALSFAALGERDVFPWKHRIRMLALEGQIYESDAANAELAQSGQFDFAFFLSVLTPLFLIILLHDQRASEKVAGRHDLLVATAGYGQNLWRSRTIVRVSLLGVGLFLPFLVGALMSGVDTQLIALVFLVVFAQILFWTFLCLWASARPFSGPAIASGLLAFWVLTTFVMPAASDAIVERAIPAPEGGDIILAQREKVNDAWDLRKEATMEPFVAQHPEWADDAKIERPFEWKWYYAFQQVGDQAVAAMSNDRRVAVSRRNEMAGWFAFLSPSALTQRSLSHLANTDVGSALTYQHRVRNFHAELRSFYYPLLFKNAAYRAEAFESLPEYDPAMGSDR